MRTINLIFQANQQQRYLFKLCGVIVSLDDESMSIAVGGAINHTDSRHEQGLLLNLPAKGLKEVVTLGSQVIVSIESIPLALGVEIRGPDGAVDESRP
jgi:hypothetical protein